MSFSRPSLVWGVFPSYPCPCSGQERDRLIAGGEELC